MQRKSITKEEGSLLKVDLLKASEKKYQKRKTVKSNLSSAQRESWNSSDWKRNEELSPFSVDV